MRNQTRINMIVAVVIGRAAADYKHNYRHRTLYTGMLARLSHTNERSTVPCRPPSRPIRYSFQFCLITAFACAFICVRRTKRVGATEKRIRRVRSKRSKKKRKVRVKQMRNENRKVGEKNFDFASAFIWRNMFRTQYFRQFDDRSQANK